MSGTSAAVKTADADADAGAVDLGAVNMPVRLSRVMMVLVMPASAVHMSMANLLMIRSE